MNIQFLNKFPRLPPMLESGCKNKSQCDSVFVRILFFMSPSDDFDVS